jgi:hypothetical protein
VGGAYWTRSQPSLSSQPVQRRCSCPIVRGWIGETSGRRVLVGVSAEGGQGGADPTGATQRRNEHLDFLPVLFLIASLLSGTAVLPQAQSTDIYLAALGVLLTVVYMWGLVFRPSREILGMGLDSLVVLALYGLGIAGLVAVAHGQ